MNDRPSGRPSQPLLQATTVKWFVALFGSAVVYAIVRYHLAGDVAWAHFPLFVKRRLVREKRELQKESAAAHEAEQED